MIKNALKQSLIGLLSSKKAMMAIISAVVAGLMKLGFHVDSEVVWAVITPLSAAILGQGIADTTKKEEKELPLPPPGDS